MGAHIKSWKMKTPMPHLMSEQQYQWSLPAIKTMSESDRRKHKAPIDIGANAKKKTVNSKQKAASAETK